MLRCAKTQEMQGAIINKIIKMPIRTINIRTSAIKTVQEPSGPLQP